MTTSWALTFIETHPAAAFFLMMPVGFTLIALSWQFATVMENGMNLILRLANIASNTFVIAIRGYAPLSAEAEEVAKREDKPDSDA